MINTPRKNGYSFKYGTLFYVPFFSCHLGISETFIRLYIYAIDFLLISSIFSNLSLKIFFIINRVLEHTKKNKKMEIEKFIKSLARKGRSGRALMFLASPTSTLCTVFRSLREKPH